MKAKYVILLSIFMVSLMLLQTTQTFANNTEVQFKLNDQSGREENEQLIFKSVAWSFIKSDTRCNTETQQFGEFEERGNVFGQFLVTGRDSTGDSKSNKHYELTSDKANYLKRQEVIALRRIVFGGCIYECDWLLRCRLVGCYA
jgi:hypothetical protein